MNSINKLNEFGLRDKISQSSGLSQNNPLDPQITTYENNIVVDTRDCIGIQSLADARAWFKFTGGRTAAYGKVVSTTGIGINPVVVTFDSVTDLKNGDTVTFKNVRGNTAVNGIHIITAVTPGPNTATIGVGPNGNYTGGGDWARVADSGYPETTDKDSIITGNTIIVNLEKELKMIRTMTLFHCVIPRDIIPLIYWLSDFIKASTDQVNKVYDYDFGFGPVHIATTDYTTSIPQEAKLMETRMIGFYSSPLDLWRTYTFGAFSMQNQVTPPPLNLWNPPGPGAWPLQPIPYPFQTVPTYRSNSFTIPNSIESYYVILSGYGVYDLVDWTIITGNPVSDALATSIIRKLLLILICPIQSYKNVDYVKLICYSNTTTNITPSAGYGFGDYQRYVCGPGCQLNYQPGSNFIFNVFNGSGSPVTPWPNSPIPFPNFRGNVWGPYNSPGDRFQRMGLQDTVQDLYLNGDLNNLLGTPIIVPNVPTLGIPIDPSFGLNFSALITVNMGNVNNATNPNITNAMRITANGFGAAVIRAEGGSAPGYVSVYNIPNFFGQLGAGGIGPSVYGTPMAWVNNGIYSTVAGTGSFADPIAQGPISGNLSSASADASTPGGPGFLPPIHSTSFNDNGANNGLFQNNIQNYIGYAVNDIPDTDLIVRIEEAKRDEFGQSTRSFNGDALLDVPIRLNVGSTSGTIQYIEALQALVAQSTGYWQKLYVNSKSSINKLHLAFYNYEGKPIPLEKMLQPRQISEEIQTFLTISSILDIDFDRSPFSFNFLFDPLNPQLIGRMKRYIQFIFKSEVYTGMPPGLQPNVLLNNDVPPSNFQFDNRPYM